MIRILIISLCCLIFLSSEAYPSQSKQPNTHFNNYVEGALVVYSQFKKPTKEESEEFYSFIKTKWSYTKCSIDCSEKGEQVAARYVEIKNIEIKPKP